MYSIVDDIIITNTTVSVANCMCVGVLWNEIINERFSSSSLDTKRRVNKSRRCQMELLDGHNASLRAMRRSVARYDEDKQWRKEQKNEKQIRYREKILFANDARIDEYRKRFSRESRGKINNNF